jgi:hypothetical protein
MVNDGELSGPSTFGTPFSSTPARWGRDSSRNLSVDDTTGLHRRRRDVGSCLAHHESVGDAQSLASIDRPPGKDEHLPASKIYHPISLPVLALLMPASIFGVLARLGLQGLVTYDGQSIFPLAYVQATGCFIMGLGLGMKGPFGNLYVPASVRLALPTYASCSYGPLYTSITTGDYSFIPQR